ncbi:EAL domain-containing protein [Waterburya agarophytonicola K14]|uniref:EAL domain-containing protein n=2 Tax=Waterburya TaxID=2886915 RepID=A0A964BMA4_9CYAN|nr:EAL domain-containing protein [Waterburya agarophytonicola KI4]
MAGILEQQNSLLSRVEEVLSENQRLRLQFQELTEREALFRQIAENVREVFFVISAKTDEILYISPTYEKVWGRSCQSLYEEPQSWLFAIHPEDSFKALATIETQFRTGDDFEEEYRIIRPDESICWVRVRAFPVRDVMGKVNRFVGIAEDITNRRESEEALRKSEEQFRLTFEMAPIGMAISSLKGKFRRVNQALCDALGYTQEELLGVSFAEISHPEDWEAHRNLEQLLIQGKETDFQIEKRFIAKDGRIVDTLLKVLVVHDSDGKPLHFNNQIVDITERKSMEKQLRHDALHDALTGLPNRALFMDRLEQQLKKSQNNESYLFAVLFLDLDRFKVVNDSVGHLVGDKLLIEIARRLEKSIAPTDTVARLGGDEFTILLENIASKSEATLVAESIYQTLTFPFHIDGYELFSTASIGIALSSVGYDKPEDILRDADVTMYSAKEQGKARYEVFDNSLRDRALLRLEIETDLRRALERKEFEVYYQPITSLKLGILSGFEALVRWNHPTKGRIQPGDFIPICEETGLIVPLSNWLLKEACQTTRSWQLKYPEHPAIRMSINLSAHQFRESQLIQEVESVLQETGLSGKCLKLEITESTLIDNLDTVTEIILHLREKEIQFSIDDFGTGYSSLSYLHRFPVDTIKIDRSFVSQMQAEENSAIVKAIVTLAHMLNMDVIAEGIETTAQLAQLRLLQCEYGQGFFFSKPLNKAQAEALIASSPKWETVK